MLEPKSSKTKKLRFSLNCLVTVGKVAHSNDKQKRLGRIWEEARSEWHAFLDDYRKAERQDASSNNVNLKEVRCLMDEEEMV